MKLLSPQLVSSNYVTLLRQDLAQSTVCRFLIAYVSQPGLSSIGTSLLTGALRDRRSFGVSSMSCRFGYAPLLDLQTELGPAPVRLRYFMDPRDPSADNPDISLFHSKLIYLYLGREQRSVVYIGSHNWTGAALGPNGTRNTEASLRLEFPFEEDHLSGAGTSLAGEVNRHLIDAWEAPNCYPATPDSLQAFAQWTDKVCKRAPNSPVDPVLIILAVCKTPPTPADWLTMEDAGIYVQALEEQEGRTIYDAQQAFVLVWESQAALAASSQPFILHCKRTASNAGPSSALAGNNASPSPMEGFKAVIFDEARLAVLQGAGRPATKVVRIPSGSDVNVFDFDFPTTRSRSQQVDGTVEPLYQIYMQTNAVVFPAGHNVPPRARYAWHPQGFAVARSRDSARYEKVPGYIADQGRRAQILHFLEHVLHVNTAVAKALPISEIDVKVGRLTSHHPLHDTYMTEETKADRSAFYATIESGILAPDIDEPAPKPGLEQQTELLPSPLERVQRLYTMPSGRLLSIWKSTADSLRHT